MPIKIVFLDALTMGDTAMDAIARLGDFKAYPSSTVSEAHARVADCEVAIVNKVAVDAAFLDAAPKLRLVCEAGTGINNIDVQECARRGVIVRNVSGYSTDSVAQTSIMHLLNLAGRAFHYDSFVKSGLYATLPVHTDYAHPFMELAGKTLGVIGMGPIGRKVAGVAAAIGMKVIYYSTSGTSHCKDYPSVHIDELLRVSDAVSINAPYNARTAGLVCYERMKNMKSSAFIINTGRGGIAPEADLARALDEGLIAGVALDVYEKEPLPADSPLLSVREPERVLFSPHIAWASVEAKARLAAEMARNIAMGW